MITVKYLVTDDEGGEKLMAFLKRKGFQVREETRELDGKVEHLMCVEVEPDRLKELLG